MQSFTDLIKPLEDLVRPYLEEMERKLGVDVIAFYVGVDPFMPTFLRCLSAPAARYPEAASHFRLRPIDTTKGRVAFAEDVRREDHVRNYNSPAVQALIQSDERNKIFGDFVTREDVVSRGVFLHLEPHTGLPAALLTANYRQPRKEDDWFQRDYHELDQLFQTLVEQLPIIKRNLEERYASLALRFPRFFDVIDPVVASDQTSVAVVAPRNAFARILELAVQPYDVSSDDWCGTIHLFDPSRRTLKLAASVGRFEFPCQTEHKIDAGEGVISWVALRQQSIWIPDFEQSPAFQRIHVDYRKDMRSQLAVPMMAKEKLLGVLSLESPKTNVFDLTSVGFLTLFCFSRNRNLPPLG